ncbi:MAG: hypothetical protein WBQ23_10675 [Bacteroidota bacterium]
MQKYRLFVKIGLLAAILFYMGLGSDAFAVTRTWVGVGLGNWNTALNWRPSSVSGITGNTGDAVIINTVSTITMNASSNITIASLPISASSVGLISDKKITTGSLTVSGSLVLSYVSAGGAANNIFDITGAMSLTAPVLSLARVPG